MNREEWTKLTNWDANSDQAETEWETIHTVYQWHPAIADQGGKQVLAGLFKIGGMGLLRDMETAARVELAADEEIRQAEIAVEEQKAKIAFEQECLKNREWDLRQFRAARVKRLKSYTDQGFATEPAPARHAA
jgi:hypothetical protein